jgi:glycopeptide antibiotics resistance protein
LFQVVTSQDINTSSGNNFVPFLEILRYKPFGRLFVKNIIGNVIMFIPYGFFVSKYASGKKFILNIFLVFLASLSIECTQLAIGRVFDVDDILLNAVGGLLGYLVYVILDGIYNILPKVFKANWFLNILALILLIGIVFGIVFIMI